METDVTLNAVEYDIFFSYATEDRSAIVLDLVQCLRDFGLTVWIDESEMVVGDDIRHQIELGLDCCRCAVVLLSPNYFAKSWTMRELKAVLAKASGAFRVLPVWHQVTEAEVRAHLPTLADRVAANTNSGIQIGRAHV